MDAKKYSAEKPTGDCQISALFRAPCISWVGAIHVIQFKVSFPFAINSAESTGRSLGSKSQVVMALREATNMLAPARETCQLSKSRNKPCTIQKFVGSKAGRDTQKKTRPDIVVERRGLNV